MSAVRWHSREWACQCYCTVNHGGVSYCDPTRGLMTVDGCTICRSCALAIPRILVEIKHDLVRILFSRTIR